MGVEKSCVCGSWVLVRRSLNYIDYSLFVVRSWICSWRVQELFKSLIGLRRAPDRSSAAGYTAVE